MNFTLTSARLVALLALAFTMQLSRTAEARRNGIQAFGCSGCHGSNTESTVTFTPDRDPILPGDLVNFTAAITSPGVLVGGIFVVAPNLGELGSIAGQGLILSAGSLTHTAPKADVNDVVTFQFTWQAPAAPGAVILGAFVLAGNGNKLNTGDAPGEGYTNFVVGCDPQTFHYDFDEDGYGGPDGETRIGCADQPPPDGFAESADDCDDTNDKVHPDAKERCNDKDDDCDLAIDEDTMPEPLFPDPDGDGFYGLQAGDSIIGCLPLAGYADEPGDCLPDSAVSYPGADEVCNLLDDNCDGRSDEFVRPRCGTGRCEVESPTCDPADCQAAPPLTEHCNGLDDDCNGIVDDGDLCAEGEACLGIHCVALGGETSETGGSGATGGSAGAPAASGGQTTGGQTSGGRTSGTAGASASSAGATGGSGSETGGHDGMPDGLSGGNANPTGQGAAPAAESGGCGVARSRSSFPALLAIALALLTAGWRRTRRHAFRLQH